MQSLSRNERLSQKRYHFLVLPAGSAEKACLSEMIQKRSVLPFLNN